MYFIFITKNTFKSQCVEDKLSLKLNIRCNTKQEKRQPEGERERVRNALFFKNAL